MTFSLADARWHLARAPHVLRTLVQPLPEPWLRGTEGPGTWSPVQVVRHLIWCEVDDWIPRARIILVQRDTVPFNAFDREGGESRYAALTVPALLDEFERLRADNLRTLDSFAIDDEKLALPGRHPVLGAVTLRQLLACWTAHDLVHFTQISRTLARQYQDAVGPWRQFMGVMKDQRAGA
jgi:hypothetical protein